MDYVYKIIVELSWFYSQYNEKNKWKNLAQVHIFVLTTALKMKFECWLLHYSIIGWHPKKKVLLIVFVEK